MNLSVIIPIYSRIELVAVHLREIMKSSKIPDEIIIVNDGGDIVKGCSCKCHADFIL